MVLSWVSVTCAAQTRMPSKRSLGPLTFPVVRPGLLDLKKSLGPSRGPNIPRCSIAFAVVAQAYQYQWHCTLRAALGALLDVIGKG
jgi:hypothetical protein